MPVEPELPVDPEDPLVPVDPELPEEPELPDVPDEPAVPPPPPPGVAIVNILPDESNANTPAAVPVNDVVVVY